nr:multiple inositol polyphosphate phosphatase 1-like [Vanessa tameamea]
MDVTIVLLTLVSFVTCKDCYWNARCPYQLFSSKTPYESVRGDLRDENMPNCQPISLWSLHRHGNRNPNTQVTEEINELQKKIISEISLAYENNRTQLTNCFQDIEDLLHWSWNTTLETSPSYLTGIGYEEIFDIGKRVRQKFETLLSGTSDKFYFRPTNEQRTITSAIAFVHGLTYGTKANLTGSIDGASEEDNVIRPYESCAKYQEEVKKGQTVVDQLALYDSSPEVLAVRDRVQRHLGIHYQVTVADTYNLYELCRFHRSWSPKLLSPWCSFFSNEDLEVMEYRDDVRHYYRNGHGSEINVNLGAAPLKDLYENFENATLNRSKNIVSYFTHDTMFEMVISALGLYKDTEPLQGASRNANRLWRTSEIAAFSTNLIAVLFKCQEQGDEIYRVQFLINEKLTTLCPEAGCTWKQFVDKFQIFKNTNFEFCLNKEYLFKPNTNRGVNISIMSFLMLLPILLIV